MNRFYIFFTIQKKGIIRFVEMFFMINGLNIFKLYKLNVKWLMQLSYFKECVKPKRPFGYHMRLNLINSKFLTIYIKILKHIN